MITKNSVFKLLRIIPILVLFMLSTKGESQCADAGKDTIVCGFNYQLVGSPANGHWTYLCNAFSEPVVLDSITQDSLNIKIGKCGIYIFVYHVNLGPCISSDTVVIGFENTSFRMEEINYKMRIYYPSISCPKGTKDSCGSKRILPGIIPPKPNWEITLLGRCDLFGAKPTTYGLIDSSCTADSIVLDLNSSIKLDTVEWNTSQEAFIDLDVKKNIVNNKFNTFFNFITQSILDQLDLKCPLQKCFNSLNPTCTDTSVVDTLNLIVPVHKGGRWYLHDGNSIFNLNDTTVIALNGKDYLLEFEKGVTYIGPEDVILNLYSIDNLGNRMPLKESAGFKIVWREEWVHDTIPFYYIREVSQDACFCNGTTTNFSEFQMPAIPEFSCDSVCVFFNKYPELEILGKDLVCIGSSVKLESSSDFNTYQWSNSDISKSTLIYNEGRVYLTVTDDVGCEGVDSIDIKSVLPPQIRIQADKAVLCRGECTSLHAITDSLNKVIWNNVDTLRSINICPTTDVVNFVKAINSNGCEADTMINIRVFNAPKPFVGNDLKITCTVKSVRLNPVDPDLGINRTYSWSGPGVGSTQKDSISFNVTVPGIYVFEVKDSFSGCIGTDTIVVEADTLLPKASAGPDLQLNCENPQLNLNADSSNTGAGFTIIWSGPGINAGNRNDINPLINRFGTYVVRIRNINNNCEATDTARVTSDFTTPNASRGTDKFLFCDSAFVTIGGLNTTTGPDVDIVWTGPGIDSTNKNVVRPQVSKSGTYTLIVTNKKSLCKDTAIVIVTAPDSLPDIRFEKNGNLGCNMDTVIISASKSRGDKLRFTWSGPRGIIPSSNDSIVVNFIGKYYLFIYDSATHCSDFDSILIEDTGGRPFVNAGPDRSITCEIINVILDGSSNVPIGSAKIEWSGPGIGTNSAVLKPSITTPGFYLLRITDSRNNCSGIDSVLVIENLVKPFLDLGQDQIINCDNDSIRLLAKIDDNKPTYDFRWAGPGVTASNSRSNPLLITIPGTYSAIVNTPNPKCVAFDTIQIGIDTAMPPLNLPSELYFDCNNRNINYKVEDFSKMDSVEWFDALGRKLVFNNKGFEVNFTFEGNHSYVIHYKNGCNVKRFFEIIPYTNIIVSRPIIEGSCIDVANGKITLVITGGKKPFYFEYNGSKADANDTIIVITGVQPGSNHKIRIYDFNGPNSNCFVDVFFDVPSKYTLPTFVDEIDSIFFCRDTLLSAKAIILKDEINPIKLDSVYFRWLRDNDTIRPLRDSLVIDKNGFYNLHIINKNGCGEATYLYYARQIVNSSDTAIYLPNVFTPNEMTNNLFRVVYDTTDIKFEKGSYKMQIYSRWGEVIFESSDPYASWDGYYKGQQSPQDTYWVLLRGVLDVCGARKETIIKRSLNLIR